MLKNLAFRNPEGLFADPTMVCIDKSYFEDVHTMFCNMFPRPRFLWVKREELEPSITKEVLSKIDEHQASIIVEMKKSLKSIDDAIEEELDGTGIHIHELEHILERPKTILRFGVRANDEVPYRTFGTVQRFVLKRAWMYWIVKSKDNVPRKLARMIYADDVGSYCIRTNGHAGNADPDMFARVDHYHIDSKEGLIRFAELVNRYYDEIKNNKRHKTINDQ